MSAISKPLAILCIAAILAAALVPGALLFAAALIVVVAVILPLPEIPQQWPGRAPVRAPRFLRAATKLLRAPPLRA